MAFGLASTSSTPTSFSSCKISLGGEVSAPVQLLDEDNQAYWALLKLNERFAAHRANPKDDYALFQQQVESELREEALGTWIEKRIGESFVRIDEPYKACAMDMPWLTQSINAQR